MKFIKYFIVLLFIHSSSFLQAQSQPPKNVLFVGNSYTYFWNLPQAVGLMASERDLAMQTRQSTAGGSNWGHHWQGERELNSRQLIQTGDYDAVVLQNHSLRAIKGPDSLMHYGQLLGELIKQAGAQPYLYITWGREWDSTMQKTITKEYTALAEKINARIVPVGPAWQRARELNPEIKLYAEDGSHPSTLGTYLSACVFFGILSGQSPVGLPHRLITVDKDGEKLYINIQSKESASFCQQVAEEIINRFTD